MTRFGPYELTSLLGRGGMGEVWRAVHVEMDREVAVKVLPPGLAADADLVRRFRREAAHTARLRSPYIVPIHQHGDIDGRLFLEMYLVDGTDLGTLLTREGALAPRRAVGIVTQVARALAVAHAEGLVHRDVKPSNVMVTALDDGDEHVYLIDFGIARLVDGTRLSRTGIVVGTPTHMAPEQFDGEGDARSDVYSLACVLFECLTGRLPFTAAQPMALWRQHAEMPPPRPSEVQADVPSGLDDVIVRAMAKDPGSRFATVAEFAAAARAALTERPERVAVRTQPIAVPWAAFLGSVEPVALAGGSVAAVSGRQVHCLDVATGARRWSGELGASSSAPPLVVEDSVYVGCDDGALRALGPDGTERWRCPVGGPVDGGAAVDGDVVHVLGHDHHLYTVAASDGRVRGRTPVDDLALRGRAHPGRWNDSTPVVAGGRVLVCSTDGSLRALDARTGAELWRSAGPVAGTGPVSGPTGRVPTPVVVGDLVAVVGGRSPDPEVTVLDVRSGALRWQRPAPGGGRGRRVVAAGGRLFVRGSRDVVALDPGTGVELWRVDVLANVDLVGRDQAVMCLNWSGIGAYDVVDGRRLWHRPLSVDRSTARVAAGAAAVVVSDRRRLVALDPHTGAAPPGVA